MKPDYLKYLKERKEIVSLVLFGISVFLAVLTLIKVGSFFAVSARAERLAKTAIAQNNTDDKDMEKYFAESKAIANELKRENLFAPSPPKEHPVKTVPAILGDEVLINDKWYKVGDMVGDARIVAIESTRVKIEWDGKEKFFAPIDVAIPSVASGPKRVEPDEKEKDKARAETVSVQVDVRPMFGSGGWPEGGPGFGERVDGMKERFLNMSEAERDKFMTVMKEGREEYMKMSEAERIEFKSEMLERFGGGQPSGGGRY